MWLALFSWHANFGSFYCISLFCWLRHVTIITPHFYPFLVTVALWLVVSHADQVFSDLRAEKRDGKRDALTSSVNPKLGWAGSKRSKRSSAKVDQPGLFEYIYIYIWIPSVANKLEPPEKTTDSQRWWILVAAQTTPNSAYFWFANIWDLAYNIL